MRKVAYRLTLTARFQGISDVFHVSQLRKYFTDPDHVVNDANIELTPDLNYVERIIQIIDRGARKLRQKTIPLVKVLWNHHLVRDAIWEMETNMRRTYPELFQGAT
jgi:hypothetical protein